MAYDFGNIYGMTKQEFETAIAYYQNKITQMEDDYSINPGAKRWFLKRYNDRIKKLSEAYKDLQETINTAKDSGYVNESTATMNSLTGSSSSDSTQFSNMTQSRARHNWGQAFRIIFSILLPVVGTIPLTISAVRSRRRFKAVQNALRQENIDMNNFVNETNRTHDAGLGTAPAFTEEEMKKLLENPAEIDRLEALTDPSNPTLSPAEKAVLIKKLTTLKAYGQNHGYKFVTRTPANNSEIKALTDAKFNTSVDKISAGLSAIITPTNLEEAHTAVLELRALKTQAESLRVEGGDNRLIDNLISKIDAEIATNTSKAQTFIDNGFTAIDGNLTAAATLNASITDDKARYNDSNARLDSAYTTVDANLGVDLVTARTYAEDLGLATDKFENLKNKYESGNNNNNAELANISARETFVNQLADLEAKLTAVEAKIAGWSTSTPPTGPDMIIALGELNYIKGVLAAAKPYADAHSTDPIHSDYEDKEHRLIHAESTFNDYQHLLDVNASNFDVYANMISVSNKPVISSPWVSGDDDKSTLITKKSNIQAAIAIITGTPNIDQIMVKAGRHPDLVNIKQLAEQYIRQIDERIAYYDKDLPKYQGLVTTNQPVTGDSITTLQTKKRELEIVKRTINNDAYKSGMEAEVNALVSDIDRYIGNIDIILEPYETMLARVETIAKATDKISKKLAKLTIEEISNSKTQLDKWLAELNTMRASFNPAYAGTILDSELASAAAAVGTVTSKINAKVNTTGYAKIT